ncbi:MAG: hypothetical protein WD355_06005 [Balneolaceae bacterium]
MNDQYHFSIYGYLDASADTQWVRVMPVRADLILEPAPIDAIVTLEHVETGESTVMNDSLVAYAHGVYAWNFWTTMDLEPGEAYRLTAEDSDGNSSLAVVSLPPDFPTPTVNIERWRNLPTEAPLRTTVIIDKSVETLADIQTVFQSLDGSEIYTFQYLDDNYRTSSGDIHIVIESLEEYEELLNYTTFPVSARNYLSTPEIRQQIFIAVGGSDYLDFSTIDEKIISLPEGVSNIENGIGYLAGIVSKTIPYQMCRVENTTQIITCDTESPPW